jgi:hypothetical protein
MDASAASPLYQATPSAPPTPAPTPTPDPCTLTADFSFAQTDWKAAVTFDPTDSTPQTGGCAITKYQWNFDDTTPPDGTYDQTILVPPTANGKTSHDYGNGNRNKQYRVTLKVSNASGSSVFQQVILTMDH